MVRTVSSEYADLAAISTKLAKDCSIKSLLFKADVIHCSRQYFSAGDGRFQLKGRN